MGATQIEDPHLWREFLGAVDQFSMRRFALPTHVLFQNLLQTVTQQLDAVARRTVCGTGDHSFPIATSCPLTARRYNRTVFDKKRKSDRDLTVPTEVEVDPKAREVLRAWVANDGLVCALRPETWPEAGNWGIVLADVARHVANAVRDLNGTDPGETIMKIRTLFVAELDSPTDEPTGHF